MKERFDVYRHEDEEVIVTTGALNGFAEASQLQRKGPSAFSYSLDGTNYNPEIYIPDEGEFMILPTDILENIHFYLSFRYSRTGRLSNFSFSYRHFNDVKGNFVGEKYEIGSEAVLKDFVGQPEFKKIYEEGEITYDVKDQSYKFVLDRGNNTISFLLNDGVVARFSSTSKVEDIEPTLYLPATKRNQ